ncbi:hypothetical protein E2562_016425 [Oryza meyeriana var. granulata]|uniref:DUF7597 domain-containing protein n=1 Tax=Oryza meyeriana var. granulata TaxID=110450 RepID=A0A6G1EX27_9ORYZ|nr:hypothetical protein E2562_016425 [Oryza meyeriana var. granulata]
MGNIDIDPGRFLEAGQHIQDGSPFHLAHANMSVSPLQKQHEAYMLVEIEPAVHEDDLDVQRLQIKNYLQNELGLHHLLNKNRRGD